MSRPCDRWNKRINHHLEWIENENKHISILFYWCVGQEISDKEATNWIQRSWKALEYCLREEYGGFGCVSKME